MNSSNQTRSIVDEALDSRPVHGGIRPADLRALGLRPEDVLDFSASVSPLGPPEGLWEAWQGVDLTAYPDPECLELREALARQHQVSLNRLLVGNGSTELIHLLGRVYLTVGDAILLFTPTYGEYTRACQLAGGTVVSLSAEREAGFSWDLTQAERVIAAAEPRLVFLCNPNNPTGVYLEPAEVEYLAGATQGVGGLLVIDEAYLNFVEEAWDSLALLRYDNVVLLRSMTKDYALTGLRLGYTLASPETTARLAAFQPDWSVNGLAQVAGLVALADSSYLPRARKVVCQAKELLTQQLTELGFRVYPSAANYLLVQVGDAASWRDRLMLRGLFLRDCASFGLPDCLRIGIRSLADCQRLLAGFQEEKTAGTS